MRRKILNYFTLPLLLLLSNNSGNSAPQPPQSDQQGFNPGPDVIAGNMAGLYVDGEAGTQRGLAMGITTCNGGNAVVNFFAMPNTNHPAAAQNLYRMSGGPGNNDRFEQIGQAWVKHTYGAKQANACNFGCMPGGNFTHLGVGCSDTYFASQSAEQADLGSRAWINPFTGVFPSNARDHTGHTHTDTSHKLLVQSDDLNQTLNQGATYYAELLYITPDEYAWCQTHPGECNMYNNASYLRYNVSGTTSFNFSAVGSPVRMAPAVTAWPGATIKTIEPAPGADGRAFLAYKVTGPVAGLYHYEYAIYNQNLDRAVQSFSVPMLLLPVANGVEIGPGPQNIGFHAPPQHPGFPNDGTQGDAGFSSAAWFPSLSATSLTWSTETFAQNPNANAIRWGTLYNFRFDSGAPPEAAEATIGFFKTSAPITVAILGPGPTGGPSPTPAPTATPCGNIIFSENFDEAVPPGWVGGCWSISTMEPDSPPNDAFCPNPAFISDCVLDSPPISIPSASTVLTFRNFYNLENGFDGGVLEVSSPNINGGAFTDVTNPAMGGSFMSGGYNGTISALNGSPIAGRLAWTGNSGGYIDTVVNLGPNLNGQTIKLRWRFGSDNAVGAPGWRIDTISITSGSCGTPTPTSTPTPAATPTPTATATVAPSATPTATPSPTETPPPPAQAVNLSTRMEIGTGDNVGIGGFIITGTAPKQVLIRALGPSLAGSVPNPLADPVLELHGPPGFSTIINDNWRDTQIPCKSPPTNDLESAICATLAPGAYTAIVRGKDNTTGTGLVEIYDLDQGAASKLANLSTRALVGTGDDIVIAGFILGGGSNNDNIVVRGIGPSLTAFGAPNALADPTLELRNSNGVLLVANDNWQDDPTGSTPVILHSLGLGLTSPLESGIAATLAPGAYTALLSGANNGTGLGLVEVYDLGARW